MESEGRTLAVKISTEATAIDGEKLVRMLAENDDFQFTSAGVLTLKVLPGTPLLAATGELLHELG